MASYDAIARVSETVLDVLRSEMLGRENVVSLDRNEIELTSPNDVGADSDTRLSLYLYEVESSDYSPNRQVSGDRRSDPPLALDLNYLLTSYPSTTGADETTNSRDQHSVLGLAMQVLHDNATLDGATLGGGFDPATELKLTMDDSNTAQHVWGTFQDTPMYPSVAYTVSPVHIDSRVEEEIQRVEERDTHIDRKQRPPSSALPDRPDPFAEDDES